MLARLSALGRNFAIYGLGDVATNIVSFLLLPLYTRFLTPADYGAISLLLTVEVVAKIVFRCGLDASFMRLFYDSETDADRQRLASTIFWFLAALNGVILALLLLAAPFVSSHLFGVPGYTLALVLQLLYTFVVGFYFIPFHVMRMEGQSRQFSMLTTARAAATLVMRLVLIVGFGLGVLGFVLADVIVGIVFTGILARWFRPLLRFTFSRTVLDQALRFGLPRLPHGVAQQVMAVGDRYILRLFGTLAEVGVYSIGASFGLALKLALSAFEYAWAPFYYETMKQPDAKQTFTLVTTYGIGVLVLLEAGLAAIAPDVVRLMTTTEFYGAAAVIPWIGLGVVFNGVYLLTSIGLNITKSTKYYPVATAIAAGASVGGNLVLVPRYGAVGAAWANAAAYAVLAVVAMRFSQRVYPVKYEWGRLARLAIAGGGAFAIAWLVPDVMPAWLGLLVRGSIVMAAYPLLLVVLGFYDRRELAFVGRLVTRGRQRQRQRDAAGAAAAAVPVVTHEETIESAGAIVDVPLAQDDDDPDLADLLARDLHAQRRHLSADVADDAVHERGGGRLVARAVRGAVRSAAMVAFVSRRPPIKLLIALVAIGAIAAALRLIGITFGLPAVYNPDEIAIMSRALAFAKGDLNPHNFLYPTFYFYVLFAWVGASFVVTWLLGIVPSLAAFQAQFFTDPTNIYLAGRLLGVTCGVATVLLTYALGARLAGPGAGRAAGLAAALFLAVSPTNVRDSHYVKHDVPVTLTVVIAQLAILRLLGNGAAVAQRADATAKTPFQKIQALSLGERVSTPARPTRALGAPAWVRGPLLLAGATCGMAFSTHYYTVFLTLPLVLAIYFRARQRGEGWRTMITDAMAAGIAATVVFFALSPFLLVEPGTAYQDIVANRQIVVDRAVAAGHGAFASAPAYARMLWSEGVGGGILLAALAGIILAARDRERWRIALVLIAFPIAFLAFISNTVAAGRYLNPALPAIAAFAALAVSRLPLQPVAMAFIVAGLCASPFLLSLRLARFFQQTDTRTLAQHIIERDIPPGATVLVQPYSVVLHQSRESLVEALQAHLGDPAKASTKFALRLALDPYPSPAYRTLFLGDGGLDVDKIYLSYQDVSGSGPGPGALAALRQAGVQYVVLKRYNVEDPAAVPLREQLKAQGRLIASVTPYRAEADETERAKVAPFLHNTDTPWHRALERPGPGIEVWQVP